MKHLYVARPSPLVAAGSLLAALAATAAFSLAPSASAQPSELFFSEYVEGSASNKALEIYNGTGSAVTLTGAYSIQLYANGSATPTATIALTGTVASGDAYVFARSAADPAVLAVADQTTTNFLFNGNDAVALLKDGAAVDVVGQIGADPGAEWGTGDASTADNTIRRKPSVVAGDANGSDAFDPASEWDGFPIDTFDGLGVHTIDTGGSGGGGGGGGSNHAPVAADDSASLEEDGGPTEVPVLVNDSDSDGDPLVVAAVDDPAHGAVSVTGGSLTYVPDVDFNGADSLTYTVSDGNGGSDTANVSLTVTAANDDPDAEDDAATIPEDAPGTVAVISNDDDVEGDALFVTDTDDPEHGSVTIAPDGKSVIYAPDHDYNGSDTFEYTVSDGGEGTDFGEVVVSITPVNDPPIAAADSASVQQGASVLVSVLANDSPGPANEGAQTLTVASVGAPSHGAAERVVSGPDAGKVRYTPGSGYSGSDSFTYVVSDGEDTANGAVSVTVTAAPARPPCSLTPTIVGTVHDDVIVGTPGDDVIRARRGHDVVNGNGGDDVICGGPGNDRITAGDGNDRVAGGTGSDTIVSTGGNDRLRGGFGRDSITTGAGNDRIAAGPGDDTVAAGDGRNVAAGGPGDDRLTSGSGDDRLDGGPGIDTCAADGGTNSLVRCE